MNGSSRPRPESGLELYAWMFMRFSGVLLLFLALGHLAVMHLINNVEVIDFQFVARRYATPFWRTYDLLLLWLALTHGINGLRTLVGDYISSQGWRVFSMAAIWAVGIILLALGSLAILTFQPAQFAMR